MKLEDAIFVHMDWKNKLTKYIKKCDHSLDHKIVGQDNVCELGQWIYSEGEKQYSSSIIFQQLKSAHSIFHKEAGKIVEKVNKGEKLVEGGLFDSESDYGKASLNTILQITNMISLLK